ncbi:hypothetical protein SAMN06298216_2901 [Spirosomataceae bacterium TFI 002]|nr:hypothetical protein SAMN06298216_2901 [Spirosomataceae bacterium TFI 002]
MNSFDNVKKLKFTSNQSKTSSMNKGFFAFISLLLISHISIGQAVTKDYRIVSSAVPFLTLSPDSKAASLGDAGVASEADAASIYWNTAKLTSAVGGSGINVSYAPWLRDIIGDMGLMNISGYHKLKDGMVLTGGFTYFDQGNIQFTTNTGADAGEFDSREMALVAGLARKFSQDLSGGLNLKYISSNLTGNQVINGQASRPGKSVGADLSFFYHKDRPTDELKKNDVAFGLAIQNIGGKINYGLDKAYYLPTNLKVGMRYTLTPDVQNKFNFLLDFNKLLVPTPQEDNSLPNYSSIEGLFKSFGDAPGGFGEELREINSSVGAEYLYEDLLAIRAGYFFQPQSKGGLKYATMGVGVKLKEQYGIDLAYLIPTTSSNPLANTWRISVNFLLPKKQVDDNIAE